MATFSEVHQIRLSLKMKLSQFAWYKSSRIFTLDEGLGILISVKHLDNTVRKIIPPVIDGISIRTEIE